MINNMDDNDAEEFIKFAERNWGTRINRFSDKENEVQPKKRGRKPLNK